MRRETCVPSPPLLAAPLAAMDSQAASEVVGDRLPVVDSGAFMMPGGLGPSLATVITAPGVRAEVERAMGAPNTARMWRQGVEERTAAPWAIEAALEWARTTGDQVALSDVDMRLLALTLESREERFLVTDDHALQNAASWSRCAWVALARPPIREARRWIRACPRCEGTEGAGDRCDRCGGRTSRRIAERVHLARAVHA